MLLFRRAAADFLLGPSAAMTCVELFVSHTDKSSGRSLSRALLLFRIFFLSFYFRWRLGVFYKEETMRAKLSIKLKFSEFMLINPELSETSCESCHV